MRLKMSPIKLDHYIENNYLKKAASNKLAKLLYSCKIESR